MNSLCFWWFYLTFIAMNTLKEIYQRIPDFFKNTFVLIGTLFLIWMFFFDTNTLWSQFKIRQQLNNVKAERNFYKTQIKEVRQSLYELETNNTTQEKFAREKYYMKKANEDVFVIEEE